MKIFVARMAVLLTFFPAVVRAHDIPGSAGHHLPLGDPLFILALAASVAAGLALGLREERHSPVKN